MSRAWHCIKIGIVGATFGVCAAAVFIRPLPPRRAPEPRARELYAVVIEELAALREADYSRAYRQVSLDMQERYNVEAFAEVIRTERPELADFEHVEFGALKTQGRTVQVPAYVFFPAGEIAAVRYTLVREGRAWKIDRAEVERRWGRGHRLGGTRT
jgi:hypothetical protein